MFGITAIHSPKLNTDYGNQLWKEAVIKNNILFLKDVFDSDIIHELVNKFGVPNIIANDHLVSNLEVNNLPFFYFLGWLEKEMKNFKFTKLPTGAGHTSQCFNFCINKKQINRYLLIRLVEYFKLTQFDYTWSGIGRKVNDSIILNEMKDIDLPQDFKQTIMSEITLPTKFIEPPIANEISNVSISNYGGNIWTWENGLCELFSSSAVSLISESCKYDRCMVFTEKTGYAMLGLTFPIWIGGYKQADEWEKIGFDVFSDIIDHSYQYKDTLIERCYYAVKNNLKILNNLEYATQMRTICIDRLISNQQLIMNNCLAEYNQMLGKNAPDPFKPYILSLINRHKRFFKDGHYDIL
jgi:hypothetical protein